MRMPTLALCLLVTTPCWGQQPQTRFEPRIVRDAMRTAIEQQMIPGAVVVISQAGQPLMVEAFGQADSGRAMTMDALFRIASMTKPITSAAIMALVEEGKLRLDDPVSKFIPEFARATVRQGVDGTAPLERPITIHHLLTQTSGIAYGLSPPEPLKKEFAEARLADGLNAANPSLEANMQALARIPLLHQPGRAWTYGMNTDVLGRVIEVASGQPFDRYLEDKFFRPLKMTDTGFRVAPRQAGRLAALYAPDAEKHVRRVTEESFTRDGTTVSPSRVLREVRYVSGGAGLVSTASDYARFLNMLLNQGELDGVRVLSKESVQAMTQNQIGELNIGFPIHGQKFGFGFGITTRPGHPSVGSYSWGGMYHTFFWVDPERRLVAVVMTQIWPWGASTLWADFQKAVYASFPNPRTP